MPHRALTTGDEQPTVVGALDRMVDAVQNVVTDQIALARIEAQTAAARAARGGGFIAGGALLGFIAWLGVLGVAYALLVERLHPAAAFGIITAVNLAIAAVLVVVGMRLLANPTGEKEERHDGAS